MAEFPHVDRSRARKIALATAVTVGSVQLLLGLVIPSDQRITGAVSELITASDYPVGSFSGFSASRFIAALLVFAVTGLAIYGFMVVALRAVRPAGGSFAVLLLGWGCTALGVGAATPFALAVNNNYWPSFEVGRTFTFLPWTAAWILMWGWVGALAAAVRYAMTADPATRRFPADGRKAFKVAAIASAPLVPLMVVSSVLAPTSLSGGNPAFFPEPLSHWWYMSSKDYANFRLLDLAGLLVLVLAFIMLLSLALGVALIAVRPRRGAAGVFLLGWGCAVLACGGVGLLRGLLFLAMQIATKFKRGSLFSLVDLGEGVGFGILAGWLVGAVAVIGYYKIKPSPSRPSPRPVDPAHRQAAAW